MSVMSLYPTSTISNSNWTPSSGTAHAAIASSDTLYVQTQDLGTQNDLAVGLLDAPTNAIATSITIYLGGTYVTSGGDAGIVEVFSSLFTDSTLATFVVGTGAQGGPFGSTGLDAFSANNTVAGSWTKAELDAMVIDVGNQPYSTGAYARIDYSYIDITYTIVTGRRLRAICV